MTNFAFDTLVSDPMNKSTSAALGTTSPKWTVAEIGKAVKLGNAQNYIAVANNDPIEGFVTSVEPWTVNNGYAFGGVQRGGRHWVEVGATFTVALGDTVVAAPPVAVGTPGNAMVRPHTVTSNISNAGLYAWRVIRFKAGVGTAGALVLVERV